MNWFEDCECEECPVSQLKVLMSQIVDDLSEMPNQKTFIFRWPFGESRTMKSFVKGYLCQNGFHNATFTLLNKKANKYRVDFTR
jgi:hypothetical protein